MIPKQDIDIILKAAVQAPSGHNYQPWKFKILDDAIVFQNAPENDTTVYNYQQRGSMVAHGAALENAVIVAESLGYACTVEVHSEDTDTVATLHLVKGEGTGRASLAPFIEKRTTNRKPFTGEKMSSTLAQVSALPPDISTSAVLFEESPEGIARIGDAWGTNDWLVFNERVVHDALFGHIVWGADVEREVKKGLFIDTFELPPPVRGMFNILKHWPVAKVFGIIGFGNVAAKQNAENVYTKTSAIGAIMAPDFSRHSLIQAGRALQHLWLKATAQNLSMQLVMGAYYISLRAEDDKDLQLSAEARKKLSSAKKTILETFPSTELVPIVLFRIGKGETPSALSSKRAPVIVNS